MMKVCCQVLSGKQVVFNSKSEYQVIDDQLALFLNSAVTDIRFDPDLHEETLLFSNGLAIRAFHNHPADEWYILEGSWSGLQIEMIFQ